MSKIVIIGGGGRVGSNAAFALQVMGLVREIVLIDANVDIARATAPNWACWRTREEC